MMLVIGGSPLLAQNSIVQEIQLAPSSKLDVGNGSLTATRIHMYSDSSAYSQIMGNVKGSVLMNFQFLGTNSRWFNLAFPLDTNLSGVNINTMPLSTLGNAHPDSVNIYEYDASSTDPQSNRGTWKKTSALTNNANGIAYSIYMDSLDLKTKPVLEIWGSSLNNGVQNISAGYAGQGGSYNQGWNYLPNPYPSSISWSELKTLNPELTSTYYVHNGDSSFAAYNGILSTPRSNDSLLTDFIPPMQSFFAQIRQAGNITMDNSVRRIDESPLKFKTSPPYVGLKVVNMTTNFQDEFYLGLSPDFSDSLDLEFEGYKMFNEGHKQHNVYASLYGAPYVFLGLNEDFSSLLIPLEFKGLGSFNVQPLLMNIPMDWTVKLEDLTDGTIHDLRKKGFDFMQSVPSASTRFFLHINKNDVGGAEELISEIYTYIYNGRLHLRIPKELLSDNLDLNLIDASGRKVWTESQFESSTIEIPKFANNGIYTLVLYRGGKILFSQKLIH